MTAPRSYPAHAGFHWAITESYHREQQTRIAAFKQRKAKKEGKTLPRRNPLEMWDFHPGQFALKVWREERKQAKELCEEARRNIGGVGMKPVDEATRLKLYYGISRDGEGRQDYLQRRVVIQPEDRYHLPLLTSWDYGWQISHKEELFDRPAYRRASRMKESWSRNCVPKLHRDYDELQTMITETHQ